MGRRLTPWLAVMWLGGFVSVAGGQQPAPAPRPSPDLPDAPGRSDVVKLCSDCHSLDVVTLRRFTPAGWEEVLEEMSRQGTVFTDENYERVLQYLSVHFGRVNVNTADAAEIALVLELTPELADRVVRHRSERGPFLTLPDLAGVPGLDAGTLERQKARISFQPPK